MPYFDKGDDTRRDGFGPKQILRSTNPGTTSLESYTFAHESLDREDLAGTPMRYLQRGEVLAKITSGDHAGKVGVYQADAADGRGDAANIVGLNDTYLPYQLEDGDQQVAAYYQAVAVQGWCTERNAAGERVVLTDTVADAMRGTKGLDILFK